MPRVCLTDFQREKMVVNDLWKKVCDCIIDTFQVKKRMKHKDIATAIGVNANTWGNWRAGYFGRFCDVVIALYRAGYVIRIEKRGEER